MADRDVTVLPIEKRNVGTVFQNYALFPNMNVAQNVAYGLKVQGVCVQGMLALLDSLHWRTALSTNSQAGRSIAGRWHAP